MTELDEAEMVPSWEAFPELERYSLGWRMGCGEDYRYRWYDFIATLAPDYDTRIAYLNRHRPAPINWADIVLGLLYPGQEWDEDSDRYLAEIQQLIERGTIAYDAAYQTWLQQQSEIAWPWLQICGDTPAEFARYSTREFWFFSRQYQAAKQAGSIDLVALPPAWEMLEPQLLTGELGNVDPSKGLLTLAQMLCTGTVLPPWTFDLLPSNSTDSFEMDMGYVDAFSLWMMSAFDDNLLLSQILDTTGVPIEWSSWIEAQSIFGVAGSVYEISSDGVGS